MKFQFPHFHRINSAQLVFSLEMAVLWFGLAAFITINILTVQKGRPAHWNKLMMLFEAPLSIPRHIELASLLWKQGLKEEARQLMTAAQPNVLGATTDPLKTLAQWEGEVATLNNKYVFWQSVATAKPDYRDAYIMLSALAYQLGKLDEARVWLARGFSLDPNSPTIQELSLLLK